jgi:hypothetical protein
MRTAGAFLIAFVTLGAMSCTSVAPVKINAGDQCFRCGRTIDDTRVAGERIIGFVEKFRAPGCMAKYVVAHPDETGPIFVADYASGKMVKVTEALFVPIVTNVMTGESDYRAYVLKAEADAAAVELHTSPVTWQTVLDRARS